MPNITPDPISTYQALIDLERLLTDQQLLSKTDASALDEILTRAVRKVAKQHPELKLTSKWDLRNAVQDLRRSEPSAAVAV